MRNFGSHQRLIDWASASGAQEEPEAGDIAQGMQYRQRWPGKMLNWVWAALEGLAEIGIRAAVGSYVVEPVMLTGFDLTCVKWSPFHQMWFGLRDAASGNLYWSRDGIYWEQGASYTLTVAPTPQSLDFNVTLSGGTPICTVYFTTEDGSSDIMLYSTTDPTNSGTNFSGAVIDTNYNGPGWVFTRKEYDTNTSPVVVTTAATSYPVNFLRDSTWYEVSGIGAVLLGNRIVHYAENVWYGVGSGGSGFTFVRFYDTAADVASGSTIYSFATVYPNFEPECIDINPNSGKVVVFGRDDTTATGGLRVLYSNDFGVTWADATVPEYDFGAMPSSTTVAKIRYLGGSCWVAMAGPSTGFTATHNVFFSTDDGVTWNFARPSYGAGNVQQAFIDFDFSGEYFISVRDGQVEQLRGAVIP